MSFVKNAFRALLLVTLLLNYVSCVYPSRATINFKNVSGKDIRNITIEYGVHKASLGSLRTDGSLTWNQHLRTDGSIDIVVEFVDGTKFTHSERYFTNHREIDLTITRQKIETHVIYEGFL